MATKTFTKAYGGQKLWSTATNSYKRLAQSYLFARGATLTITSGHRSDEEQEVIFRQRFTTNINDARGLHRPLDRRLWEGRYWYRLKGYASAAAPGTSNHRSGIAADFGNLGGFNGTNYRWLAANAGYHGWNNVEGARINEPWHWQYVSGADRSRARKGWYHVATPVPYLNLKAQKRSAKKRAVGFNVYATHGIKIAGAEYVVTKHGNAYPLSSLAEGKAPARPVYRKVKVAVNTLHGRAEPSMRAKIKYTRSKGYALVVTDVPGHPDWVVTKYGTYYAKEYVK